MAYSRRCHARITASASSVDEPRRALMSSFDSIRIAAPRSFHVGAASWAAKRRSGRQLNIVAGDRVERLAQAPPQLRAQVDQAEALILGALSGAGAEHDP